MVHCVPLIARLGPGLGQKLWAVRSLRGTELCRRNVVSMVSPRASLACRSSFVADQPGGELGCLGGRSDLCFWQPILGAALETDFLKPVPMGSTLHITAKITGQVNRKVYSSAEGRLNTPDGPLAVRAAALFVIVPMDHFLNNAPKEYLDHISKSPEILAFVDPDFEINP